MFNTANHILGADTESRGLTITLIAENVIVKSAGGPEFIAERLVDVDFDSYDLLLIPGGPGSFRELYNPTFKDAVATLAPKCEKVITVSTGSALLAATGFLDGIEATTDKLFYELSVLFGEKVSWVKHARWVRADHVYTSSGVSAGTDMTLEILQDMFSQNLAWEIVEITGYEWNSERNDDPFVDSIPKSSAINKGIARIQKSMLDMVFEAGSALGFEMKGLADFMFGAISRVD